jgi:hypothetical protein
MADSDYNMIKPVEGLPNIPGLTPAKRREERKRRQHSPDEQNDSASEEPNDLGDQARPDNGYVDDDNEKHFIDYRA